MSAMGIDDASIGHHFIPTFHSSPRNPVDKYINRARMDRISIHDSMVIPLGYANLTVFSQSNLGHHGGLKCNAISDSHSTLSGIMVRQVVTEYWIWRHRGWATSSPAMRDTRACFLRSKVYDEVTEVLQELAWRHHLQPANFLCYDYKGPESFPRDGVGPPRICEQVKSAYSRQLLRWDFLESVDIRGRSQPLMIFSNACGPAPPVATYSDMPTDFTTIQAYAKAHGYALRQKDIRLLHALYICDRAGEAITYRGIKEKEEY
ncbi:uncharacterized protein RAG0_09530 [Rhynchosporium agropyri]|uniref:Uncharacterized protein n=1 Tax=Rhynchosporium agropyri TaxID=914238 RepID=A0A1E1KYT1_9HELO|nr:uncharacterized protein RAG0_09530 [Rhynchosporium agropyri]